MKNIIKITSVVLILLILASCTPAVEPTGTGATSDPTTPSTETIEYTPEELLYNKIYLSYEYLYLYLLNDGGANRTPNGLNDKLEYYLENFAPEIYEQYNNPDFLLRQKFLGAEYPSGSTEIYSTYNIANQLEIPKWLTRELLANQGYSGMLLFDLTEALYTCETEEDFHAFFDEFYEPIKEDFLSTHFLRILNIKINEYVIDTRFNNNYDEYAEWFYSREFRHSEILEKYCGLTPQKIIHMYVGERGADCYPYDGHTQQISIPEYVYEFEITEKEYMQLRIEAKNVFEACYPSEKAPSLGYYLFTGGNKHQYDTLIQNATTPQDTYEINLQIYMDSIKYD